MKDITLEDILNPIFWTDGYKMCHKDQYPVGMEWIYETWTPRQSRVDGIDHVIFYGLQGVLHELNQSFKEHFFNQPIGAIEKKYKELVYEVFKSSNMEFAQNYDTTHLRELHELGYLPLKIKALPEGTFTPIGVPMFTIENTRTEFFWLPGYLESQLSSYIWSAMTSATMADKYKRMLLKYAKITDDEDKVFVQAGDFSMRGMSSPESSIRTAGGHLLSFGVSSSVNARSYLMKYYEADTDVVMYAPSTEHSVMCSYGEDEYNAYKQLITKIYPSGNVSIVSDTYDLWNVVDEVLPRLKKEINDRNGKIIIRPDSGDPVKILCGDKEAANETVRKGIVERLYEEFGGRVNEKGFKVLNPKIGVIYGDSITPERTLDICEKLMNKGLATTNVNLGIGSYTYQYRTRDTFGFALKGTAEIQNGQFKMIQKRPATDSGNFKKSNRGMVAVVKEDGQLKCIDGLSPDTEKEVKNNLLKDVYVDGKILTRYKFGELRAKIKEESQKIYEHDRK